MKTKLIRELPENKLDILFAVVSALIIILLIFFVNFVQESKASLKSTQINARHLDYSDRLLINMLNVETSARGYLLTENKAFLKSFNDGIENTEKTFNSVEKAWPDYLTSEEIEALEMNIQLTTNQLATLIAQETLDKETKLTQLAKSKVSMDNLREKLGEIRSTIKASNDKNTADNYKFLDLIKWVLALLCVISFSLLLISFNLSKRQQKLLKSHADSIAQRNITLEETINMRTADLVDLASHLTSTSENEKQRLAQELHDELGALLTAARMDSTWISRSISPEDKDKLNSRLSRLTDSIDKSIALKRNITSRLVPPLLREMGLEEAINAMAESDPNENPPTYNLNLSSDLSKIHQDKELALYRICQESLNNIWKYAHAKNISIDLKENNGWITLLIKDDGIGFDLDDITKGTHGIAGMRSRASMFEGTIEFESKVGKGTIVTATIPLTESERSS